MVEWRELGDICYISDYVSNGSFASLRENVTYRDEPNYAILIRYADYSNSFDESKFVYIDEHAYNFLSKSSLEGGEIIMSNVGSCGMFFRCPKLNRKMSLAPNSILIKSEYIDYLHHWFGSYIGQEAIKKITSKSAMPKFNKTEFKKIQVPIPSKEEQARIVSILDTFTDSIANLDAQIKARRKQYEYYRDQLLDLEGKDGVEMKILKDLAIIMNGKDYKKLSDGNIPVYGTGGIMAYVDTFAYDKPSVLLPRKGSVEKIYYVTNPFWTVDTIYWTIIKTEIILPKFLYHALCKYDLKDYSYGGGIPSLSQKILYGLTIPLPSLQEQSRIVSILDQFEESIKNLEAQYELRKKQYEYYRNQLLSF